MLSQSGEGCHRADTGISRRTEGTEPSQQPWSGRIEDLEAALRSLWDLLDQPTKQFLSQSLRIMPTDQG